MVRINATISCTIPAGVNIQSISGDISRVIRNLTGTPCRVVNNVRETGTDRVNLWSMKRKPGNIELRPR